MIDAYLPTLTPKVGIAIGLTTLAGIGTVLLVVRARYIFPRRRCTRCGYDRTHATSDRCTECGITPSTSVWRLPPTSTFFLIGLLWVTLLTWPAYKAYRWCEVRNWTPPLPRYSTKVLRRYSTGHVLVELKYRSHFESGFPFAREIRDVNGDVLVEWTCWGCWHGTIQFDLEAPEDLDRDGLPDVLLRQDEGGSGNYLEYRRYQIHPNGEIELVWDFTTTDVLTFRDFDRDGNIECRSVDTRPDLNVWRGLLATNTVSFSEWNGSDWSMDFDLMRQPPPSEEAFDALVDRLRDQPWSERIPTDGPNPYWTPSVEPLYAEMLRLVHEGNGRTAAALHAAVWPAADTSVQEAALTFFAGEISPRIATWSGLGRYARVARDEALDG